jgi:hypothetical protein
VRIDGAGKRGNRGMGWREEYEAKRKTAREALRVVESGDRVWIEQGNATPQPLVERAIDRSGLYIADEIFFTGTAVELAPVRPMDHRPVGGNWWAVAGSNRGPPACKAGALTG